MKKTITILAAMMMVFSFAGMASALDAVNCAGDGDKYIICEQAPEQGSADCTTFDFENKDDYCGQKQANRAVFPICDCVPDYMDAITTNQEYGIRMEIMVDKHDGQGIQEGDNFVYWTGANNVKDLDDAMSVRVFNREGDACATAGGTAPYYTNINMIRSGSFGNFPDDYNFLLADGTTGVPASCPLADPSGTYADEWRTVELELQDAAVGFQTQSGDSTNWVVNIPEMWAEFPNAQKGWTVYVNVCFNLRGVIDENSGLDNQNICEECECCFMLKIGTLCCDEAPVTSQCTLTFPYFPMTSSYWYGMAVTNTSPDDGTATVALYENDGDTATGTITIPAHSTKVIMTSDLTATGTLGDAQAYVVVTTNFSDASGFAMMAKENNGVSMGYLAEKCGDCGCDD